MEDKNSAAEKRSDSLLPFLARFAGSLGLRIIIGAVLVVLFYMVITGAYGFGRRLFDFKAVDEAPGTEVLVVVGEDMSHRELAKLMEKKGLITDSTVFTVQEWLFTSSKYGILPGTYKLSTSMNARELIDAMSGPITVTDDEDAHIFPQEPAEEESEGS